MQYRQDATADKEVHTLKSLKAPETDTKVSIEDVITAISDTSEVEISDLLIEEEVNRMLSRLLKQAETLDLSIDQYLSAQNKTAADLKKEYEQINPNVVILQNTIDPFYYPEPKRNETDIIRIGITGSVGITSDVEVLKPIIEHYQNDPRVRLVLLSLPPEGQNEIYKKLYVDEYAFWNKVNVEWHSFVGSDVYYEYLNDLKLDMVIIPRSDSYFNRCKSNLKFLENSMLEIPTIGQSFLTKDSPYEINPEDAKHLLLATDTESWIFQIEQLIANKELRREMGRQAKEYVVENYSIEKLAHLWKLAYDTLFTNK